jgi:hypothetical protein
MLRPLSVQSRVSRASLLARAILFHGLHGRIPTTIVHRNEAEDISARCLSPVIKGGDLNVRLTRGQVRTGEVAAAIGTDTPILVTTSCTQG